MNEPPGARLRVGLSGLTMAEYFRDQGQDVLLFIDNIFRFVQAGSEVSALLGRMPSAVGYQPTLATEMGQLQERITSTRTGSVTSVQAIYVPADDLTDPAPANTFAHLDATTVLTRAHRRAGHLPGRRPARLDLARAPAGHRLRRALPDGDARAGGAAALQGPAGHHRHPRHRRALRRGQADRVSARARSSASSRSRTSSPSSSPARPGQYVKLEDTIAGFREILDGKHDELPEQAFYMVGTIEEAVEKGAASSRGAAERERAGGRRARPTRRSTVSLVTPDGRGFEGEAEMLIVPGRGRRDRRARAARAADRDAQGRLDAGPRAATSEVREFATGPGFFKVEQDRAIALVDDAVDAKEIDVERARSSSSRRRRPSSSGSRRASPRPTAGSSSSASGTPRTSSAYRGGGARCGPSSPRSGRWPWARLRRLRRCRASSSHLHGGAVLLGRGPRSALSGRPRTRGGTSRS